MALGTPSLVTSNATTDNQTSYTTASFKPTDGTLVMAFVQSSENGNSVEPNTPTLSGGGVTTWTKIAELWWATNITHEAKTTVWIALQETYGTAATLTFDFGAQTQSGCFWAIVEVSGASGAGTAVTANSDAAVSTGTVDVGAPPPALSLIFGVCGTEDATNVPVPTSPATSLYAPSGLSNPVRAFNVAYVDCDGTIDSITWTWTSERFGAIGFEVFAAPDAPTSTGWSVWNGTTLVPNCRVRIWNGTALVDIT